MKQTLLTCFAVAATFVLVPAPAQAALISYSANLTGAAENPPNASTATGSAFVIFDDTALTLRVMFQFSGLSSITAAAHIHCCVAAPGNVGVASPTPTFPGTPLGVTSGSYDQTFDLTLTTSFNGSFVTANGGTAAGARAALISGLNAGNAYLNIHTVNNPGGEIRGFLAPVPEPGTFALAGLALAGVLALKRRRA